MGYDGDARYVALWHCGDDIMVGDGTSSRTGRWYGFESFWDHPLVQALLRPYRLQPGGDDPYLDTPHRLLADRWEQTLAVGETADVTAFIHSQPNPLIALTEGLSESDVTALVEQATRRPLIVDIAQVHRSLAENDRLCDDLRVWLDARLTEVRDSWPGS